MNDFGETEMPKGKEFAKFLVLSEGKLPLHLESVDDLVHWCYSDILRLLFQYMLPGAILPPNYAVNFTFISWHFH